MNKPDQDPNNPAAGISYQPSKFLTNRRKVGPRGQSVAIVPAPQNQTTKSDQANRGRSEDGRRKFVPNQKGAILRNGTYDPSKDEAMDEEDTSAKKRDSKNKKSTLLLLTKEKTNTTTNRGPKGTTLNTSNKGIAFGGGRNEIKNYNKVSKAKLDLFGTDLAEEETYKAKNYLFPVEVKIKTDKKAAKGAIKDATDQLIKDTPVSKGPMDVLVDEFCFFQLPANLPLEGCYQATPKTEDTDIEINTSDLLSSFLNNRFDSTGFYLEREFKCLIDKNNEKMDEEKDVKKGKESKDKISQENLYDTLYMGKLCRMKNGELKMKIGNNLFDVTEGVQDSFYKELYAIDYQEKVAMALFPIEKKFVIKPDMKTFQQ